MTAETHCKVCGRPMTIEYEENPFFSLEKLLQMTTCNNCCDRRGRKFHQPTTQPTEQNLPYSDL